MDSGLLAVMSKKSLFVLVYQFENFYDIFSNVDLLVITDLNVDIQHARRVTVQDAPLRLQNISADSSGGEYSDSDYDGILTKE